MRLAFYAGASTAAAAACLLKAFHQRPNFYSATVYLSQSNACLLILTNLCLVFACAFVFALQRVLYGRLRPVEIEQLSEKAWYAVLDTLLAMPSFREDVGGWLLTMFVLLLAGKVWGWIGEGRVDVLEQQPPANPRLFHARLSTSLALSVIFDIYMLVSCIDAVIADPRPGMMVIFTFEFAIQCIFSIFTLLRYGLIVAETLITKEQTKQAIEDRKSEIRAERAAAAAARGNETVDATVNTTTEEDPIEVDEQEVNVPGWEQKRRYLFMLEVISDFIKLVIYLCFFTVSITFNGLPMHIMRDVYMTFASFSKRVSDYVAYRRATSDMNTRYSDATTEEIRGDACIICRETMVAWNVPDDVAANANAQPNVQGPADRRRDEGLRAKKLPCGHVLHIRCLKSWLERQQVCPTCRRPVVNAADPVNGPAPNQNGQGQQEGQQQEHQRQQQHPPQQRPQRQPARPNRARIFNLGPIRIGLLNAPNGQLQNIVEQLRNPDARNPAPGPADREAPDATAATSATTQHSTGSRASTSRSSGRGARTSVPTQIQLMQIEQRLLQEAHNLGLEQQQLATLRVMEAELARLRAHHIPRQPPVGVHRQPPQTAEVLQGNSILQLGNGDAALPSGLIIPEGWSVVPLHRVGGALQAAEASTDPVQSQGQQVASGTFRSQSPAGPSTAMPSGATSSIVQPTTSAPSENTSALPAGPTDGSGSPLFVPTTVPSGATFPPGDGSIMHGSSLEPRQEGSQALQAAADGGWDFTNSSGGNSGPSHVSEQNPSGKGKDGTAEVEDVPDPEPEQSHFDKGKGRAVEVEDVPDPDADPSS